MSGLVIVDRWQKHIHKLHDARRYAVKTLRPFLVDYYDGPGSPPHRLTEFLNELGKRFPVPFTEAIGGGFSPEKFYLDAIDLLIKENKNAIK